jgi:NADH:ubiquinone oxidoreductase subunit H
MSFLFASMFMGGWHSPIVGLYSSIWLPIKASLVIFTFLWVRASFPRIRYDQLMAILWKTYLPLSLAVVALVGSTLLMINGLPPLKCL